MPEDEKYKHACYGEKNGMYGKKHSKETREKIRKSIIELNNIKPYKYII